MHCIYASERNGLENARARDLRVVDRIFYDMNYLELTKSRSDS